MQFHKAIYTMGSYKAFDTIFIVYQKPASINGQKNIFV